MARFEYETILPCSQESLFEFLLRPANVARIADPGTGLSIVSAPEIVTVGSQIEFRIMGFGQVQSAVHQITDLTRPDRIIEEQIRGPLKSWRHEHLFESHPDGVRMLDLIEFQPPGGILGFIATESRISASLDDGFFARQEQLARLVASGELA